MAGNRFYLCIAEFETGRYPKAHKHASAAILICLKGKGYTYTWPDRLNTTPWQSGRGDEVLRQDYEYGGMVSAAPMRGDWFHQHFGVGNGPLRVSAWHGANNLFARKAGLPGEPLLDYGAIDLSKGGNAIPYCEEDRHLRREFESHLAQAGRQSRMGIELYEDPAAGDAVFVGK